PTKEHRRKISLRLPVNASKPQLARARRPSLSIEGGGQSIQAAEHELAYKQRHTYIGTASLEDFLEVLEVTPTYGTTKKHVVKAFVKLACDEQEKARQSSETPYGWNFVTRTSYDDILTYTDYVTQSRVKLGSIKLGDFLLMVPFDDKLEVAVTDVVEAFRLGSHHDKEAMNGPKSKAKAFRSWFVKERMVKHGS
ncbi:hypothetical protein BU23DRAFT_444461, partial [Bimuria novae-zelandiae CBS 107.79]